ncbi:MAG: hypothetical protein OXI71_06930 [Gemmatimonadota bacterium]|nr:hypothetical protein [Gemmatimonadota bacterium]
MSPIRVQTAGSGAHVGVALVEGTGDEAGGHALEGGSSYPPPRPTTTGLLPQRIAMHEEDPVLRRIEDADVPLQRERSGPEPAVR